MEVDEYNEHLRKREQFERERYLKEFEKYPAGEAFRRDKYGMKYDYEFQDDMPDTNTIFWDINLQKFRTRSTGKNQDGTSLSRSFNNYSNFNTERKSQNYSANRSINTGGRRQIMLPNLNNTNNGKRELRKDFASNSKINEKDKR